MKSPLCPALLSGAEAAATYACDAEKVHLLCSFSREGKHSISAGGRQFEVTPEMLEIREETQKESGK